MKTLIGMLILGLSLVSSSALAQTYEYDDSGRLETVTYEDGRQIRYERDTNGNLLGTTVAQQADVGVPDPDAGGEVDMGTAEPPNMGSSPESKGGCCATIRGARDSATPLPLVLLMIGLVVRLRMRHADRF